MKWFKHYHGASSNIAVSNLILKFGHEGYALYMLLLELLCEKFDGENSEFEIHQTEILQKLRISKIKKFDRFIASMNVEFISMPVENRVTVEKSQTFNFTYKVIAPLLLLLQDRDFKKTRVSRRGDAPKNKIENKNKIEIKDKEEEEEKTEAAEKNPDGDPIPKEIMGHLETALMYPKEIIEAVRKDAWLMFISSTDPKKSWPRFVGAYFKNEKHRIQEGMLKASKGVSYTISKGRQKESGKEYMERMMNSYEELCSGE